MGVVAKGWAVGEGAEEAARLAGCRAARALAKEKSKKEEPPLPQVAAPECLGTSPSCKKEPDAPTHKEEEGQQGQPTAPVPEEQPVELCRCCGVLPVDAFAEATEERVHCWTCNQDLR